MPEISIIVPVYNMEKYFVRCMDSLLAQTYNDFEIILVDDGSKDKSPEMCDSYADKYQYIKVIHKSNEGLGFARNTGLEVACGKFVAFIDSDDYVHPNMMKCLIKAIHQNDADTCYSDFFRNNNGNITQNAHLTGCGGVYQNKEVINSVVPLMVGGKPNDQFDDILGWGVWKALYSIDIIREHGILFHTEKEMISEDIIFQLDYLASARKVVVVEQPLYYYCLNEGSLSTRYRDDRREKNIILYHEQLKRLDDMGVKDLCLLRAKRLLIAAERMNIMIAVKILSPKSAKNEIRNYMNDETYNSVIKSFPIKELPLKQRLFAYCLKFKMIELTYVITKFYINKNYSK